MYLGATYYSGYFEMGKYAELSSESECTLCTVVSLSDATSKGVAVSASEFQIDLIKRVCHLTNKIYREMLCITRMTYITMGGLDYVQASAFPWTPQYRIVLSWDLLSWVSMEGGISCSFTNFITTPELSGPLYISPDIYHTQITEYSLKTILSP